MIDDIVSARAELYSQKLHEERLFDFEARTEDDGTFVVEGYASTTDAPYAVRDHLGEYTETMARGSFGKSLNEKDDVRWLVNHEGIALARTASGTLDLREITKPEDDPQGRGQTGLWTSARLDAKSPLAQTVRSAIERGDMSQMSFAFQATRQEWNEDYTQRTVLETRLFDVSGVTYPANPSTSVSVAPRAAEPEAVEVPTLEPVADDEADRIDDEAAALERRRRRAAAFKARTAV